MNIKVNIKVKSATANDYLKVRELRLAALLDSPQAFGAKYALS